MDLVSMQALTMSRQLAFFACSPLSIHLALEPTDLLLIRGQPFAEDLQARFALLWDQGDGRRSQIGPQDVGSNGVFGLVIRHAFQSQLDVVAKALSIGSLRLGAAGLALDQTSVFDAVIKSVFHHRVVPVDDRRQLVVFPDEIPLLALLWLVQHETQPGVVAFVLDAGKPAPSALEAHATGLAHTDAIEGLVGAASQRLSQHRIQVFGNPGHPHLLGIHVEGIFREAVLLTQRRKGGLPFLLVCAGDGTSRLPGRISSHVAQTALSFGQHGIVEGAPRFQMAADAFGLASVNLEGQFEQKRWRFLCGWLALSRVLCAHEPRPFSCARTSLPSIPSWTASVKELSALHSPHQTRKGASY